MPRLRAGPRGATQANTIKELASCQDCGRQGISRGVLLRERVPAGTLGLERRRLCDRCGSGSGWRLVYGRPMRNIERRGLGGGA